jgi:hypothetical protein
MHYISPIPLVEGEVPRVPGEVDPCRAKTPHGYQSLRWRPIDHRGFLASATTTGGDREAGGRRHWNRTRYGYAPKHLGHSLPDSASPPSASKASARRRSGLASRNLGGRVNDGHHLVPKRMWSIRAELNARGLSAMAGLSHDREAEMVGWYRAHTGHVERLRWQLTTARAGLERAAFPCPRQPRGRRAARDLDRTEQQLGDRGRQWRRLTACQAATDRTRRPRGRQSCATTRPCGRHPASCAWDLPRNSDRPRQSSDDHTLGQVARHQPCGARAYATRRSMSATTSTLAVSAPLRRRRANQRSASSHSSA